MKTFNKNHLPETIVYNNDTYKHNIALSSSMNYAGKSPEIIQEEQKSKGVKCILVGVLNKNLKDKTDLRGQPYKRRFVIYTNQKKEEQDV